MAVASRTIPVPSAAENGAVGEVQPQVFRLVTARVLTFPVGNRNFLAVAELPEVVSALAHFEVLVRHPLRDVLDRRGRIGMDDGIYGSLDLDEPNRGENTCGWYHRQCLHESAMGGEVDAPSQASLESVPADGAIRATPPVSKCPLALPWGPPRSLPAHQCQGGSLSFWAVLGLPPGLLAFSPVSEGPQPKLGS